jgi:hypothetical protein
MDEYKKTMSALDVPSIIAMGDFVAPALLSMAVRAVTQAGQLWCQAVTTNVPGPRIPLYVLGCRMTSAHAYVPIAGGTRVSIGIFSYLNTMTFGINADFDAFPDVDVLSDGIRRGIDDLLDLAAKAVAPATATTVASTEATPATAPARKATAATAPAKKATAETARARKATAATTPAKKATAAKKAPTAQKASAKKAPAKVAAAKSTPAKSTPAKSTPAQSTPAQATAPASTESTPATAGAR